MDFKNKLLNLKKIIDHVFLNNLLKFDILLVV